MEPANKPLKKLQKRAARPQPKKIGCSNCAAPLEVKNGLGAKQISCSYCGAIIDLTSEDNKVLKIIASDHRPRATLSLGAKGKLKGKMWEVIGRVQMEERDEDGVYRWNEYLLFNPNCGYRWLEEDSGHWTFGQKAKHKPTFNPRIARPGTTFRAYDSTFKAGEAVMGKVSYVEGEFPYHTEVGDTSTSLPCYNSPLILTAEWTDTEMEWLVSEYVNPGSISKAFGIDVPDLRKERHGAQPVPPKKEMKGFGRFCLIPLFFTFITGLLGYFLCSMFPSAQLASWQIPLSKCLSQNKGVEKTLWLSPQFDTKGAKCVDFRFYAPLKEEWCEIDCELQDKDGNPVKTFTERVSYYPNSPKPGIRRTFHRLPLPQGGVYKLQVSGIGGSGLKGKGTYPVHVMEANVSSTGFNGKPMGQLASLFSFLTIAFVFCGGLMKSVYEFFANLFS